MLPVFTVFICCWGFLFVFRLFITQKCVSATWNSDMAQCQSAKGQFWIFVTSLWQEEGGTKCWGTENCRRQRIPNGIVPSLSYKHFICENPKFQFVSSEKRISKAWYEMETFIVQIQHGDFLLFIMVFPSAVIIKAVTPWVRKSEISVWSYFTSGSEVDRTSKSGWCFKKYFLGTSMWAQESAFRLYKKKKDPSKNFLIHLF